MSTAAASLHDASVGVVRAPAYGESVRGDLERLAALLGWAEPGRGAFGRVIPAGARVLVKPNWVSHANQGNGGFEPLVTHGSIVRAVAELALASDPASLTVGDAPLQACDFDALIAASGLGDWAEELRQQDGRFRGLRDFRRTISTVRDGVRQAREEQQPLDRFVLFDLGADSLLEPVTAPGRFRVTQYDPSLMERTHAPGRHQYLVARDVLEADVIVNLPKLKTHKKAGITCALKNLIGINGNKEYLPHHRVGGAGDGGDCYPGRSPVKRLLERALDRQNATTSTRVAGAWNRAVEQLARIARAQGDELGVEGSWSGNDTIWRTCLDLNRILLYGRPDGTLADAPQRRTLHLVDAITAGQGEGPLSADPLPLGLLLGGSNAGAIDLVGALLLDYDPGRIPICRESFGAFAWPLTDFPADAVQLAGELGEGAADALLRPVHHGVRHPAGWHDAARPA